MNNQQAGEVANEYFDPTEREDSVVNPRMVSESEWPILEVSTLNAREFLELVGITPGDDLTGEVEVRDLPNLMRLERRLHDYQR